MYNQITVVGRWVRDTEIIVTNSGTEIMNASIAVSDPFRQDHTDFIDVVAFKNIALNTNKFTGKGSKVLISGKLQQNRWEDKEGNKRNKHEIVANQIVFLDDKKQEGQSVEKVGKTQTEPETKANKNTPYKTDGETIDVSDDDLPF